MPGSWSHVGSGSVVVVDVGPDVVVVEPTVVVESPVWDVVVLAPEPGVHAAAIRASATTGTRRRNMSVRLSASGI